MATHGEKEHRCCWLTPAGWLTARERGGFITGLDWRRTEDAAEGDCPLLREAKRQIDEYLTGRRRTFRLPVRLEGGTEFRRAVWQALCDIPYGETRTYADVARAVGRPRAARAVGAACHCNPVAIVVPCHRVVGSGGRLTGYAGGLDVKERLLDIETGGRG